MKMQSVHCSGSKNEASLKFFPLWGQCSEIGCSENHSGFQRKGKTINTEKRAMFTLQIFRKAFKEPQKAKILEIHENNENAECSLFKLKK